MKFDLEQKSLSISIRELAYSVGMEKRSNYISQRLRTKIGQDVHRSYQQEVYEKGHLEYYIKFSYQADDWQVNVKGRADVVYEEENGGCYLNYVNSAGARTGVEIKQDYDAVHKIIGDAYHFLKGDE